MLREVFSSHGMKVGKDVMLIAAGRSRTRYAALTSGMIDATPVSPPTTLKVEKAGFNHLFEFTKGDFGFFAGGVMLRGDFLRSKRTVAEKFIRGTLKGLIYARENRSGTIPIIARMQKIPRDQAAEVYDLSLPAMTTDGTISEDEQRKNLEYDLKVQGIKEMPPLDKIFDFSMTRKVYAELKGGSKRSR